MRRCWGITRKGSFCKRRGDWWIFCPGHKWKVLATVSLIFLPVIHFSGAIASIYSFLPDQHVAKLSKDMEELKINFKIVTDQNEQTKQLLLAAEERHQKAEKARTKVTEHSTSSVPPPTMSPVSLSFTGGILPSTWDKSSLPSMQAYKGIASWLSPGILLGATDGLKLPWSLSGVVVPNPVLTTDLLTKPAGAGAL